METLLHHLLTIARNHPDRIALRCGTESVRYDDFRARILTTAARLCALGVGEGDRVMICGGNTLAIPVLYFSVHALGAVAAPIAPDTPESMLIALAGDAEARLAVVEKPVSGMPCPVVSPKAATAAAAGENEIELRCRPDAIADLLYTTGTSGRKKGVVLTQANALAAARNITEFVGSGPDDVEVVPLPLSHSFGLGRLRCMAIAGNTLVLEPGVGTGATVVRRILDTRATGLALVPAGFDIVRRMTGDVLGQARDHLRYIEIGSAPMKPETRSWLTGLLPQTRICHHYGLTEASRAAFTEYHRDAHKSGTAGRAAPNVEIVVCGENGRRLPTGETGEVVVRGGMVMREYWKQPELTEQTFCSEGLRTGDIGYVDADGYLFLLGRRSDLINVGGRKVAPDEIEDLLRQLDGVKDAGCVGEPDELLGECVKAYLVADREIRLSEIVAFLRTRVEECKIPQVIARIESIPRTNSGKIQRQMLRGAKGLAWTSER
ncbi:MAG: class I adenylate-forming enzyme family protein [Terriglobales bacterium]